jgi:hypothetical protein
MYVLSPSVPSSAQSDSPGFLNPLCLLNFILNYEQNFSICQFGLSDIWLTVTRLVRVYCRAKPYYWSVGKISYSHLLQQIIHYFTMISPEFNPPSTNIMAKVWWAILLKQLFHIFEMVWHLSFDCIGSSFCKQWQLCALLCSCLTKELILFNDVYQKIHFIDLK